MDSDLLQRSQEDLCPALLVNKYILILYGAPFCFEFVIIEPERLRILGM